MFPNMRLTSVEDQAIQARIAFIVGAVTFDRLFAGVRFDEVDGPLLYAYAGNEDTAAEIEDEFSLQIALVASKIIGREIELVVVMPKVLHQGSKPIEDDRRVTDTRFDRNQE